MTEDKMKRDVVKLMMTNKLLKKRVARLEEALEVIMEQTWDVGSKMVATMALEDDENVFYFDTKGRLRKSEKEKDND